jgi:hypothetical protein
MYDGVNNLWILRSGRGLSVDGFKDEVEATSYLIRSLLAKSTNDLSAAKARVEAAVADALKHMDDDPEAPLRQDSKSDPDPAPVEPKCAQCGGAKTLAAVKGGCFTCPRFPDPHCSDDGCPPCPACDSKTLVEGK